MTTQTVEGAIQEAEAGLVNYQEPRIGLAGWVKGLYLDTLRGERKSGTNTQGAAGKVIARAKAKMALELDFRQPYDTNQYLDPRITFSRLSTGNSAGTYWGSDGLLKEAKVNLWAYSQDPTNAYWEVLGGATKTTAQSDPFGGTSAAKINVNSAGSRLDNLSSISGLTSGMSVTMSFWVKAASGGVLGVAVSDGTMRYATVPVTTTWTRVSATWTLAGTCNYVYPAHNTGTTVSGGEVIIYGMQLEPGSTASQYIPTTSAASAAPRIDYDPVTLECKGLLIEESRANLVTVSNTFTNNGGASAATVSQNAVGLSGSSNEAFSVTESLTSAQQYAYAVTATTTAAAHTISAFVKAGTANRCQMYAGSGIGSFYANYGLTGDGVKLAQLGTTDYGIQKLGNGWYRVWIVATCLAGSGGVAISHINSDVAGRGAAYQGAGLTLIVQGAQVELGSFPTSYIPTTTTSLTRAADSCSIAAPYFSPWWNASEGTFVVVGDSTANDAATHGVFGVSDGTASNTFNVRVNAGGLSTAGPAISGGVSQVTINGGAITLGSTFKSAHSYLVGTGRSFSQNGSAATFQAAYTAMTSPNVISIGYAQASNILCGHISRLVYWNKRLPDATLRSLTA